MSAAAVIALRRKEFIRRFAEQGATCPERAIPFGSVGMRRSWVFERMVDRGVFLAAGSDRYYLNEHGAQIFLAAQRRRALWGTAVLLGLFLLYLLASIHW